MDRLPRRRSEPLVDGWMLMRYLIIGGYVGIATVMSFVWWFCFNRYGPLMTFGQLRGLVDGEALSHGHQSGAAGAASTAQSFANGYTVQSLLHDRSPSTMALSTLVTIEMLVALASVAETSSLATVPPWRNAWLLTAVAASLIQHVLVISWKAGQMIFEVKALTSYEWSRVALFAFPIIIVEELVKFASRRRNIALGRIH
mmetsp:Transcript_61079/g.164122  ORF Transcript_61079/g.164122 Transcript_61079/m.164122 type:complete len:200 (+) Transcript_61079:369-968(+)